MDKFLGKCNLMKWSQEEKEHMKSYLNTKEIDRQLKIFPQRKLQAFDGCIMEPNQIFEEQILSILQELFRNRVKEETFPNSFYGASVTLTPLNLMWTVEERKIAGECPSGAWIQ